MGPEPAELGQQPAARDHRRRRRCATGGCNGAEAGCRAAGRPCAAAAAPVVEAPPAPAPPADPNKSTFTVTLKNPDGDVTFECPPDQFILDEAEEQEIEGADDLPYACRAGSCSACAGKMVAGSVDSSDCAFLSPDQIGKGFVLTCTARPTSDCTITTHVEDDLY